METTEDKIIQLLLLKYKKFSWKKFDSDEYSTVVSIDGSPFTLSVTSTGCIFLEDLTVAYNSYDAQRIYMKINRLLEKDEKKVDAMNGLLECLTKDDEDRA
jgi:urate oxidase